MHKNKDEYFCEAFSEFLEWTNTSRTYAKYSAKGAEGPAVIETLIWIEGWEAGWKAGLEAGRNASMDCPENSADIAKPKTDPPCG